MFCTLLGMWDLLVDVLHSTRYLGLTGRCCALYWVCGTYWEMLCTLLGTWELLVDVVYSTGYMGLTGRCCALYWVHGTYW